VHSHGLTEIYFSLTQRKVLTPSDFPSLAAVQERLLAFEDLYNRTARPFAWRFTRQDLERRLAELRQGEHDEPVLDQAA
jgi:hypothetical protein